MLGEILSLFDGLSSGVWAGQLLCVGEFLLLCNAFASEVAFSFRFYLEVDVNIDVAGRLAHPWTTLHNSNQSTTKDIIQHIHHFISRVP